MIVPIWSSQRLDLTLFRVTPVPVEAMSISTRARYPGRAHIAGAATPLYTSEAPATAAREFGHANPQLVGMPVRLSLLVADQLLLVSVSRDAETALAGTSLEDLTADDWSPCQRLVARAFADGHDAVRLKSARDRGFNVIIKRSALARVRVVSCRPVILRAPDDLDEDWIGDGR